MYLVYLSHGEMCHFLGYRFHLFFVEWRKKERSFSGAGSQNRLKGVYRCTNGEAPPDAPSYLACQLDRLSYTSTREFRKTEIDLCVPFV